MLDFQFFNMVIFGLEKQFSKIAVTASNFMWSNFLKMAKQRNFRSLNGNFRKLPFYSENYPAALCVILLFFISQNV